MRLLRVARAAALAAAAAAALAACGRPAAGHGVGAAAPLPLPAREVRLPPGAAAGRLLVSRAGLEDPSFGKSVVLLVDAGNEGSWGLILNRPTDLELGRAFPDVEAFRGQAGVLHFGGPVETRRVLALVRTRTDPGESRSVLEGVRLCWSLDVVGGLARSGIDCRVFAGYAGWAGGQLDAELARGDWRVIEADEALVFDHDGAGLWELLDRRSSSLVVEAGTGAARSTAPGI